MADNGGFMDVGTNDRHEVVINLPSDTGHVVFSPTQARALADTLNRKSADAERVHRAALEEQQRASAPPVDRTNLCTTSGETVDQARAKQTNETGQHVSYIVLCEEERKKGFVRPYRDAYKHVGRSICALVVGTEHGWRTMCDDEHGHDDEHGIMTRRLPTQEQLDCERTHRIGGCGSVTTMGRALSETYARDPTFYGATFCVNCNKHLPVAEFVWSADGQQVGS